MWQTTIDYCRGERSLIDMWLRDAHFLSDADDEVSVGFPTSKAISRDSLDRHRGFIEEAMLVIAGRKKRLSLVVRNDLEPAPPVEIPDEAPEPQPTAAESVGPTDAPPFSPDGPTSAPRAQTQPSTASNESPASGETAEQSTVEDEFHNDPLIREALTEFEATVVKTEAAS